MYMMRFDMRAPEFGASTSDLYRAAIEMAAYGEENGGVAITISEHHASPDGYLPSPLILATAVAARTQLIPISVGALLVPLYDPIKLAEDMVVLDIVSGGRVSYIAGLGYRTVEYQMFDVDEKRRARRMEDCLDALFTAWKGEPFEFAGRPCHVTPKPFTPGGPKMAYGGGSLAAARRAARYGLDLIASNATPGLEDAYREEAARVGREPGNCRVPASGAPMTLFIARDLDEGWKKYGRFMLHDATAYGAWLGDAAAASKLTASSVDELRAENGAYRVVTPAQAAELIRTSGPLALQPLCGGTPPDLAWESLRLVVDEVLPALG